MRYSASPKRFAGIVSILLLVFATGLTGCSEDEDPAENLDDEWGNVDDEDPDAGPDDDVDDNDEIPEDPCHGVQCASGEECVEGECFAVTTTGYGCANPYDFGTITGDEIVSQTADPRGEPNVVTSSCVADDGDSPQAVFRFDVDEPVRANLELEEVTEGMFTALNKDVRVDACTDPRATDQCDTDTKGWFAEPGEDYYVIVDARYGDEIAKFELSVETESTECYPAGEWSCEDDGIVQCFGAHDERYYSCAAGECTEYDSRNDECGGDGCSNALEIRESQTFSADMSAYDDALELMDADLDCVADPDDFSNFGRDLVVSLPDMEGGELVELIPPADERFVVAALNECTASPVECVVAESPDDVLEWDIEEPGDYHAVFYQDGMAQEEFEFGVEIWE